MADFNQFSYKSVDVLVIYIAPPDQGSYACLQYLISYHYQSKKISAAILSLHILQKHSNQDL
jgi:hypothetical protein